LRLHLHLLSTQLLQLQLPLLLSLQLLSLQLPLLLLQML
jgi:hypothetical protein